jgi:hypothetical protein
MVLLRRLGHQLEGDSKRSIYEKSCGESYENNPLLFHLSLSTHAPVERLQSRPHRLAAFPPLNPPLAPRRGQEVVHLYPTLIHRRLAAARIYIFSKTLRTERISTRPYCTATTACSTCSVAAQHSPSVAQSPSATCELHEHCTF